MNANEGADDGIQPAGNDGIGEESALPSSQPTTTTTTTAAEEEDSESYDVNAKNVLLYNIAATNFRMEEIQVVVTGKNIPCINERAFAGHVYLEALDMTKSFALGTIAYQAFESCRALVLVKWSPNLETIGESAFQNCTSLKEADMSKLHALETIGDYAFEYCSALALVKWSPNLKTTGDHAFYL